MTSFLSARAFSIFLIFYACRPIGASAEVASGIVVGVSDGDTITVLDHQKQQRKIRLAGIDAPEKKQPFGLKSKQHLADLVYGKDIQLDCTKDDKYRRSICKVYLNGVDINLAQIENGLAWWYRKYRKEQSATDQKKYEATENRAKVAGFGLWSEALPIPPWEWRKSK